MNISEWLEKNAEKSTFGESETWVTKARGDYLTHVSMQDKLEYLVDLEFVSSTWEAGKPVNIGFNPEEQKWYGWSHRAKFGFGVGSECKKGQCHYRPVDKDDFLDDMIRFWTEGHHVNIRGEHKGDGVYIEWDYSHAVPNEKLRGQISGCHQDYPSEYGKGEWTAATLADARQMAMDFAEGVA